MPADPRLLVPLSELPGRVPEGSPVRVREEAERGAGICMALGSYERTFGYSTIIGFLLAPDLLLDLSPPPLVDGWPERVDGLDVAAAMLARACAGAKGWVSGVEGEWGLCADGHPVPLWSRPPNAGMRTLVLANVDEMHLDVDLDDPLAPRLAMAAALKAHPWRTP